MYEKGTLIEIETILFSGKKDRMISAIPRRMNIEKLLFFVENKVNDNIFIKRYRFSIGDNTSRWHNA